MVLLGEFIKRNLFCRSQYDKKNIFYHIYAHTHNSVKEIEFFECNIFRIYKSIYVL